MMTRELALGMMRQADTGEQMLTVADAIVGLSEDMNIADATAHFDELNETNFGQDPDEYQDAYAPADQADYEAEMFAQQA